MQVLYQLSYGPKGTQWQRRRWTFRLGPRALPCACLAYNAAGSHLAPHRHQLSLHGHLLGREH